MSAILPGFSERFPTSGNDINVALLIAALVNDTKSRFLCERVSCNLKSDMSVILDLVYHSLLIPSYIEFQFQSSFLNLVYSYPNPAITIASIDCVCHCEHPKGAWQSLQKRRDCGACSERSEESRSGLLRLRLATSLAMTILIAGFGLLFTSSHLDKSPGAYIIVTN